MLSHKYAQIDRGGLVCFPTEFRKDNLLPITNTAHTAKVNVFAVQQMKVVQRLRGKSPCFLTYKREEKQHTFTQVGVSEYKFCLRLPQTSISVLIILCVRQACLLSCLLVADKQYTDMQRTNFAHNVLSCRSCWNMNTIFVGQKQHSGKQWVRLVSHMPAGVMGD